MPFIAVRPGAASPTDYGYERYQPSASVRQFWERTSFLRWAAITILTLNLLDGALTLLWIDLGLAEEANPLMAILLERHPVPFMMAKLSLVSVGVGVLWRVRKHRAARWALLLGATVYGVLLLYHAQGVPHLLAWMR